MRDGNYIVYTIQHRVVAQSPWLKPKEPLVPIVGQTWACGFPEYTAEPWIRSTPHNRPRFPKSHDEQHAVWARTGLQGWFTLRYARLGIARVRRSDKLGKQNYCDTYGTVCQAVRHEYRLIKITCSQQTVVVKEVQPARRKRGRRRKEH